MAKRKKQSAKKQTPYRPPQKLLSAVDEAMLLSRKGKHLEAQTRLIRLVEQNPRSQPVLLALLDSCERLKDWSNFARYSEQLLQLERGQERAATLNNLIVAYTRLNYPALVWHTAQELITNHPDYDSLANIKKMAAVTEGYLREQLPQFPSLLDLPLEQQMKLLAQHDRVRYYTESVQIEKAIATAEAFLQEAPGFIPVLNNLTLAYFSAGNLDQAIAAAQKVLAIAPDNHHALANLVRLHFLTGRFEVAHQLAARLKVIVSDNPDVAIKQAEAFAFLGDDEEVRAAYQRTKKLRESLPPLILHLAAAAHYRLGDEKTAARLWRQAVEQQPSFAMARDSLDDLERPVGERNIPWHWPMPYWFTDNLYQSLRQLMERFVQTKSKSVTEKAIQSLLAQYPYLPQLFAHILERGDRTAREFVVNFTRLAQIGEFGQLLYGFALSRYGSDALRWDAIQIVRDKYPTLLPANKTAAIWIKGKQTVMRLMAFEIYTEPVAPDNVAADILAKHDRAYELLMDGEAETAEQLLKEVIAAAPHMPSAQNHLAVAYERQGRSNEARAAIEDVHARFPDYFFGRVSLARYYAQEKRLEEAKALIDPLMALDRLHISEFRALAQAQMAIALADNNDEVARSWLNMWQQMEADHPDLPYWRGRIEGPIRGFSDLKKLMSKRPRR